MEFPQLGEHCSDPSCNLLDFLPIKCDACKKVYCLGHYTYNSHNCSQGHLGDVQVPICPLCSCPVSGFRPGDPPDIAVSQHIDNMCRNSTKKVYTNRCSARLCKKKEMIPIRCDGCSQNFCLKHRHPADHDCQPPSAKTSNRSEEQQRAAKAALERQMREDEQLARALQASFAETGHSTSTAAPASGRSTGRNNVRNQRAPPYRPTPPPSTVDQPGCTIT